MAPRTSTPLLIDTNTLSKIISDTLEIAGAPSTRKSACLNAAAARIAGAKHNWGYLTGHDGPLVASSLQGSMVVSKPSVSPAPDTTDSEGTSLANVRPDLPGMIDKFLSSEDMSVLHVKAHPGWAVESILEDELKSRGHPYSFRSFFGVLPTELRSREDPDRIAHRFIPSSEHGHVTVYECLEGATDKAIDLLAREIKHLQSAGFKGKIILLDLLYDPGHSRNTIPSSIENQVVFRMLPPSESLVEDITARWRAERPTPNYARTDPPSIDVPTLFSLLKKTRDRINKTQPSKPGENAKA